MAVSSGFLNPIRRVLDFLAKMGLSVRDDPPKVIDVAARKWGETVAGFALSIDESGQTLSVVLRNMSTSPQTLVVRGWLRFYRIDTDAPLSPFGRELLKPEHHTESIEVTLAPGQTVDTQIPLGSLYALASGTKYQVVVSCTLPSAATLFSNPTTVSG